MLPDHQTRKANRPRAVAVYVDTKGFLIHQTKALWASLQHIGSTDTDLVCFGPEEALEKLPNHPALIKQPYRPHRLSSDYGYINSIACFEGPEADLLDRYAIVLKSDVDTFLTPAWNHYWPTSFRFGTGRYVHCEGTRQSIRDLASTFGYMHRGIHNIGSTFIGNPEDVRSICSRATKLTEHLLEFTFAQNHGEWPGWFRGVASMYATEVAINDRFEDAGSRFDSLDQASDSQLPVNSFPHIHCWFTRGDYSKHKWIDGLYKGRTEKDLDLNVISDYCLAMAIRAETL